MPDPSGARPAFIDRETITLTKDGVWLSGGQEITHEATLRGFNQHLGHDKEGYFIQIGHDFKRIQVEDTAYFVRRCDIEGSPAQKCKLWLSDDTQEFLDPSTLSYRPGRLTCQTSKAEEAKFLHPAYFELLRLLEEDDEGYFVTIEHRRILLASKL